MSSDPWTKNLENSARVYFAKHTTQIEDNETWEKITVYLTPIETDQTIKEKKFFSFNPDWRKIVRPSFDKLLKRFGSDNTARANFIVKWQQEETLISYCWQEYRDRDSRNITKSREKYPQGIESDEKGEYILYIALKYLSVFDDQEEWEKAASEGSITQIELPTNDTPPQPLKDALVTMIKHHGTNLTALQEQVLNTEQFSQFFSVQNEFVKFEVANLVVVECGTDASKQEKMLAEINSHFNSDTPYLTADSPELTSLSEELPF